VREAGLSEAGWGAAGGGSCGKAGGACCKACFEGVGQQGLQQGEGVRCGPCCEVTTSGDIRCNICGNICCCCCCCCVQPKKKVEKKYATKGGDVDDTPLDDPVLERLRKQRLEEEADMRCVGWGGGAQRGGAVKQGARGWGKWRGGGAGGLDRGRGVRVGVEGGACRALGQGASKRRGGEGGGGAWRGGQWEGGKAGVGGGCGCGVCEGAREDTPQTIQCWSG
jgi:hypothetical protein